MCMILICVCLAHREESTATIRGRSETFLSPLWLSRPVMDCSKYKFYVCVCVTLFCYYLFFSLCVQVLFLALMYPLGQCD